MLIIGAGGHARVCLENLIYNIKYNVCGFVVNKKKQKLLNLKHLGYDKDLKILKKKIKYACIGVGFVKKTYNKRIKIFKNLKRLGYMLPPVISKNSIVSKSSSIGDGTQIFDKSIVRPDVMIGENCIINTGAIIEHDVKIGDNCHISTGAIINGNVIIGKNCFIGSGAIIVNNIKIKPYSFVKAGQLVKKSNWKKQ